MQLLKKIPLFPLLLVLFFCVHGLLENYGFVGAGEVALLGLFILAAVVLLWSIVFLFTRNLLLAALISFFIALWYLFFGALHDWIKSQSWLRLMHSYSILLPLLLLATIAWIIWLRRNTTIRPKIAFYLNLLLLIYCVVDGVMLLTKKGHPLSDTVTAVPFNPTLVKAKPDVYYLLFDEYPGYKSLKDSFGFANDELYGHLHRSGFRVLPVFANYNFTMFSMASIFNMNYVDSSYDPRKLTAHDYQLRTSEISHGTVFSLFRDMGYRIQNYSVFDIEGQHAISDQNSFLPVHSQLLTDKILHNRIIRTSGWLFGNGWLALPSWRKRYLFQHDNNNLAAAEMVKQSAAANGTGPVFCYAHFMLPHFPIYRDSTGHLNPDSVIANEDSQADKKLYLSYLKYSNTVIKSLVDQITSHKPNAIVVVMSDHGYRSYRKADGFEQYQFNNICALRLPSNNYPDFREQWSAVNFFRYLFNAGFDQQLPYLPDRKIELSY